MDADSDEKVAACIRFIFKGDADGLSGILSTHPDAAKGHDASFNDSTPLHVAVGEGEAACAAALLASGADANAVDCEKRTPLHQVEHDCPGPLAAAVVAGGADLNARDARGWTPLHCAAAMQAVDVVAVLLGAGADANAASEDGLTPLQIAVSGDPDDTEDLCGDREDGYGDLLFGVSGAPPLKRTNALVAAALRAAGASEAASPAADWAIPVLEHHDFALAPVGDTAAWAAGGTAEIRVSAAYETDDESDDENEGEEDTVVEDVCAVTLVARGGEKDDRWRCVLLATPENVHDRAPQLGLLKGRELVVPLEPASWDAPGALAPVSED